MSEDDLVRILQHPATMIASDGEVPSFGRAQPASAQLRHVRAGARRSTCAEKHVLTLEDAMRKMIGRSPAARLGLTDRGVLPRRHEERTSPIFDAATVRASGDLRKAPPVRGGLLARSS